MERGTIKIQLHSVLFFFCIIMPNMELDIAFLRGGEKEENKRPEQNTIAAMRADGGGDGYHI